MKEKTLLVVMLIIGLMVTMMFLLSETNLVFKKPGATFSKTISIENAGNNDIEVVLIQLVSNPLNPSTIEFATIGGEKFKYVIIYKGQFVKEKVYFEIPKEIDDGKYYVDYKYKIDGQTTIKTISFRVENEIFR